MIRKLQGNRQDYTCQAIPTLDVVAIRSVKKLGDDLDDTIRLQGPKEFRSREAAETGLAPADEVPAGAVRLRSEEIRGEPVAHRERQLDPFLQRTAREAGG